MTYENQEPPRKTVDKVDRPETKAMGVISVCRLCRHISGAGRLGACGLAVVRGSSPATAS